MFSFFKKKSSASTAKDRLTIAIMSDRSVSELPFLAELKAELIKVVQKYIGVDDIKIKKEVDKASGIEALSIEVAMKA